MPDKKLTDSEIVKALECEIECNKGLKKHCIGCLLQKHYPYCEEKVIEYALDLINRQKTELNQYAEEHHNLMAKIEKKDKDIEKWQQVNFDLCTAGGKLLHERKTIRAEAYKEFAELLHCQCESIINQPHNENVRPISWKVAYEEFDEKIDNLLKEMVGE